MPHVPPPPPIPQNRFLEPTPTAIAALELYKAYLKSAGVGLGVPTKEEFLRISDYIITRGREIDLRKLEK